MRHFSYSQKTVIGSVYAADAVCERLQEVEQTGVLPLYSINPALPSYARILQPIDTTRVNSTIRCPLWPSYSKNLDRPSYGKEVFGERNRWPVLVQTV